MSSVDVDKGQSSTVKVMVAGSCCSSIRTFRICLSQN